MDDYADKIYSIEERKAEWYRKNGGLEYLLIDAINNKIQPKSFWIMFKELYTELEFLYPLVIASDFLHEIYTKENLAKTMTKKEMLTLTEIRKNKFITIYRGQRAGKLNGFSWTTDIKLAKWFSTRLNVEKNQSGIYRMRIRTSDIHTFWNDRQEKEIFIPIETAVQCSVDLDYQSTNQWRNNEQ